MLLITLISLLVKIDFHVNVHNLYRETRPQSSNRNTYTRVQSISPPEPHPTQEDQTFIEVEGSGTAPLLRRQNSLPPKYDDIFNENNDSAPSAPPIQFDLVPIRTGPQRQNSNNANRFSMI